MSAEQDDLRLPWQVGESNTFGTRVEAANLRPHPQGRSLGVDIQVRDQIATCRELTSGAAKKIAAFLVLAGNNHANLVRSLEALLAFSERDSILDQATDPRLREEHAAARARAIADLEAAGVQYRV